MTLETTSASNVGEDARRRFDEDGFLILDDPCAPELLDTVRTEFEGRFVQAFEPGPQVTVDGVVYDHYDGRDDRWHWHRIKNAWKVSDSARAVALEPGILRLLEDLFGRRVMPFQTLNFPIGTEQRAHSDSFHFQSDPVGYMSGVWIALEDMDMDNGPLVYYPGSHKLPIPTWPEIEAEMGRVLDPSDYASRNELLRARGREYEVYCQRLIERENLQPVYGTIRKGQAVVWAPNLLHGGSPQSDRSRTRHSQVTHYFFEGTRVYTPLHTNGSHNFYYYPEWIRDPVPTYTREALRDAIASHTPPGSEILFLSNSELPEVEGRRISRFPRNAQGQFSHMSDDEAIQLFDHLRSQGARYIVIPHEHLEFLVYGMPALQAHVEATCTSLVRDGALCAIYAVN